jgi:hypothetical protein
MKKVKMGYVGLAVTVALLVFTAWGSAWGDATYSSDGALHLYIVDVPGDGMYDAYLKAMDSSGQEFELTSASKVAPGLGIAATFTMDTGILNIPKLAMYGVSNSTKYAEVEMELIPSSDPMRFRVKGVYGLQIGVDDRGPMGPQGPTGLTGATGPQGPAGANGTNGAQGPQGAAGANGTNGTNGADGDQGPQGPAGVINKAGIVTVNCSDTVCYCPSGKELLNYSVECPADAYAGLFNCWSATYSLRNTWVYSMSEGYTQGSMQAFCMKEVWDCIGSRSFSEVNPKSITLHCF